MPLSPSVTTTASAARPDPPPRTVLAARTAVALVFGLNGLAVASWFARIPAAREALGLSAGRLGLLLLALSGGAVLAMLTAGGVVHRVGSRRTTTGATALVAAGLVLLGVGVDAWPSVPVVALGLVALGFGSGLCDVAMNVEAALVERRLRRTVMPRFHAAWSLGTVTGAALGAGSATLGIPVLAHLGIVAVGVLLGTLLAANHYLSGRGETTTERQPAAESGASHGSGTLRAWREPRTLLVGLLVLVMAFTEGTANDWIAVAFIDGHGFGEAAGAAVFGVFVAAMTVGRMVGTVALDRWGRLPVLVGTIGLAVAGVTVTVLVPSGWVALAGVVLWGLGASLGFPVGMSAAADDEDRAPARVSVVSAIGYTAFLAGPPLVGLLGDRVGTLRALLVVPLLLVPALALVPATRPPAGR
ncbi:MFS transporter [Micromonospora sp. HM5-17]|jgi:fucose permease|uniref:MFS transporter n=1 Tax=Micromonospora sp. HM5-17 TaxID=2487710 RepID=UPI000F4A091A|nr:MFS transporter [Micromonospora sp. HM5-17]ROT33023.1 MFS transporter [Micromonospora sp. HM5-17]